MTNVKPEKRYKYIWDNDVHPLKYGIKIELILNIYGARSIFLIFCIHKDNKFNEGVVYRSDGTINLIIHNQRVLGFSEV